MILYDGIESGWSYNDAFTENLKAYLDGVWQSRPLFLTEDEDEEERRSTEQKFFKFFNGKIKPKNYVGFVQYGDLRLNVYPRVFHNHPEIKIDQNPLPAINHVLKWLSYGRRIHFPFSERDLALTSQEDWLEALIFLFANYTLDALATSPYFAYQELTEEMSYVRGRMAMQPYITYNLAKGRHHLVHCTYEPFLYDNQFNRIVKHTCRVLQSATANDNNRNLLHDILFLLDEVTDVYCTSEDCAKVPVNRLYPEVDVIKNMCAAFLSGQAYMDSTAHNQNLCILLPMEVIYEQYVGGFIRNHFPGLKVDLQSSGKYVAKTGKDFSQDVFQMRHDILLADKIIDTKYKFRIKTNDLKAGVSQGDIYQMITYCYKRKINSGMLLYPMQFDKDAENGQKQFKIEDILIEACTVDITENVIGNFEENQIAKFKEVLSVPLDLR